MSDVSILVVEDEPAVAEFALRLRSLLSRREITQPGHRRGRLGIGDRAWDRRSARRAHPRRKRSGARRTLCVHAAGVKSEK